MRSVGAANGDYEEPKTSPHMAFCRHYAYLIYYSIWHIKGT